MRLPFRRMRSRLLLSYLLVILVGMVTMYLTGLAAMPRIVDSHVAMMMQMPAMMRGTMPTGQMDAVLAALFRDALHQSLLVSGFAALLVAVAISAVVAQGVARPMQQLSRAARRIAGGQYSERVPATGTEEMDAFAASFNEMASALERDEQRRLQLIGDVAHELRTPISTIDAYLEGILDGVIEPDAPTVALLADETGRLRRLVEDLRVLSQAESRQLPLRVEVFDAGELVEATTARLRPDFVAKGLHLAVDLAPAPRQVLADRDRTVQVMTNLLTNALRYTPSDGHVRVELAPAGTGTRFTVADDGLGLSAEDLPHVFDRFFRADKSRSRASGGSGVGLTIARALVEAMGGEISASSAGLGKGACFSFVLPGPSAGPARA